MTHNEMDNDIVAVALMFGRHNRNSSGVERIERLSYCVKD